MATTQDLIDSINKLSDNTEKLNETVDKATPVISDNNKFIDTNNKALEDNSKSVDKNTSGLNSVNSSLNILSTRLFQLSSSLQAFGKLSSSNTSLNAALNALESAVRDNTRATEDNTKALLNGGGGGNNGNGGNPPPSPLGGGGSNSLMSLLRLGGLMTIVNRGVRFAEKQMDKSLDDQRQAWKTFGQYGTFGSDMQSAVRYVNTVGERYGFATSEMLSANKAFMNSGGGYNAATNLADMEALAKTSRAMGMDYGSVAQTAGQWTRSGLLSQGDMQNFGKILTNAIDKSKMAGREPELIRMVTSLSNQQYMQGYGTDEGKQGTLQSLAAIFKLGAEDKAFRGESGMAFLQGVSNFNKSGVFDTLMYGTTSAYQGAKGILQMQYDKEINPIEYLNRTMEAAHNTGVTNDDFIMRLQQSGMSAAQQMKLAEMYENKQYLTGSDKDLFEKAATDSDKYENSTFAQLDKISVQVENQFKELGNTMNGVKLAFENAVIETVGIDGLVTMKGLNEIIGGPGGAIAAIGAFAESLVGAISFLSNGFLAGMAALIPGIGAALSAVILGAGIAYGANKLFGPDTLAKMEMDDDELEHYNTATGRSADGSSKVANEWENNETIKKMRPFDTKVKEALSKGISKDEFLKSLQAQGENSFIINEYAERYDALSGTTDKQKAIKAFQDATLGTSSDTLIYQAMKGDISKEDFTKKLSEIGYNDEKQAEMVKKLEAAKERQEKAREEQAKQAKEQKEATKETTTEVKNTGNIFSDFAAKVIQQMEDLKKEMRAKRAAEKKGQGIGGDFSGEYVSANTKETRQKIWDFFRGKGYTEEQTAAIMGNLQQESGFRSDAENDIGAFGIAQWYQDRRTNLENFAKEKGTAATDLDTQLEFLYSELQTSKARANRALKGHTNLKDMATEWDRSFEISGEADAYDTHGIIKQGLQNRWDNAAGIYKEFTGRSVPKSSSSSSTTKNNSQNKAKEASKAVSSTDDDDTPRKQGRTRLTNVQRVACGQRIEELRAMGLSDDAIYRDLSAYGDIEQTQLADLDQFIKRYGTVPKTEDVMKAISNASPQAKAKAVATAQQALKESPDVPLNDSTTLKGNVRILGETQYLSKNLTPQEFSKMMKLGSVAERSKYGAELLKSKGLPTYDEYKSSQIATKIANGESLDNIIADSNVKISEAIDTIAEVILKGADKVKEAQDEYKEAVKPNKNDVADLVLNGTDMQTSSALNALSLDTQETRKSDFFAYTGKQDDLGNYSNYTGTTENLVTADDDNLVKEAKLAQQRKMIGETQNIMTESDRMNSILSRQDKPQIIDLTQTNAYLAAGNEIATKQLKATKENKFNFEQNIYNSSSRVPSRYTRGVYGAGR